MYFHNEWVCRIQDVSTALPNTSVTAENCTLADIQFCTQNCLKTNLLKLFYSQIYLTTDGQSASLSRYQAIIWDLRPIFLSLSRKLSSDICSLLVEGALSDERTGLYFTRTSTTGPCQRRHCRVQVPQNLRPYLTVSFETGISFCRLLWLARLRCRYSNSPPRRLLCSK
jgi:hypothetical protein